MHSEPVHSPDSPAAPEQNQQSGRLDLGAYVFLALLVVSLCIIGLIGVQNFVAEKKLEAAKDNAEKVAKILGDIGSSRIKNKSELKNCNIPDQGDSPLSWGPCRAEFLQVPAIANLTNVVRPENAVFGSACDGSEASYGQIVVEKGTPWSAAGNTGVTYAAIDDQVSISSETVIRLFVCNHWGEGIKVQEIKF